MPVNIGPKIGLEGEAEYRKSIQNIIQQQKTLKSEMQSMASAWDKDTNAQKKNAQQRDILNKQIQNQKDRVAELENMMEKSAEKYGENSTETLKWKQAVNEATAELNRLEQELKNIPNGLQQMGQDMQAAGEKLGAVGDALMPISAAAAAIGVAAVKTTADFDNSMSKVAAISGATGKDFDDLRDKAREMGAQTKFSATEAADAFTYMAMAGWKTEDMMSGIDGILNLAAADGLDLATTSDIVTDALTAMGLQAQDAGHFADVLAAASTNANTNVSMMGETFKYAAPLAGALGFSVEDLAVATGLMANAGIKGSQSGTALRGWLTRLAKPTKESSTAMEALGISLTDADGNMKSLMEVMEDTRDAFQGLTEDEKAQYAAMLAGQNGMSGLLAIVNATEGDLKKLSTATKNADGTAKRMAETMQNNLNGQLTILKSAAQEAAISVGDALIPKISKGVQAVQDFTNWFNGLNEEQKQYAINAGIAVAAAGPFFKILGAGISTAGVVTEKIGGLVSAVEQMGGVMGAANAIFATSAAQIGLVAAPLVILAAAFWDANSKISGVNLQLEGFVAAADQTKAAVEQSTANIDALGASMEATGGKIKTSGADVDFWRRKLLSCYDANGNLIEGTEWLAEKSLAKLNEAMGTDYSTAFIAQANNSRDALNEVSGAVDTYIAKLKEQSLQTAFSDQYAQALKNNVDAQQALNDAQRDYQNTVNGAKQAQSDLNEALKRDPRTDPGAVAAISQAKKTQQEYVDLLKQTGDTLVQASENAAKANSEVKTLDETMTTLAAGGTENIDKAAEAYANAGVQADEAGRKAKEAAETSLTSWQQLSQEVIQPPTIDQEAAATNAKTTTDTMQAQFTENKFTGYVDKVDGGDAAAMNAAGQMTKIVSVPMQGNIDKVNGAERAASDARSAMQSFLDQHPLIATVIEHVTGGRISRHANGGIVERETLSWLAEGDNPDAVIPLSAGKRARALDLYEQTGEILGVGSGYAYAPSKTVNNQTINTGGNTIYVYGAPGQNVRELAHEIADIINGDIESEANAWA